MNLQQKEQVVQSLTEAFSGAMAAYVVDYRGCSCSELTKLRADLRNGEGTKFSIVKNTLAKRAAASAGITGLDDLFSGPSAVVFSKEDPVSPAKLLKQMAEDNENLEIKGGVVEGDVLDANGVENMANMESKEELLGKLLYLFNAPAVNLLRVMQAPARDFVQLLSAYENKLEK